MLVSTISITIIIAICVLTFAAHLRPQARTDNPQRPWPVADPTTPPSGRVMGWQGEYPFGRKYTGIRGGNHTWREWIHRIGATHAATEVVAMFDKHHVVDTLNWQDAVHTGNHMDHMDDVSSVICSYGRSHQRDTWRRDADWFPFVCQIDGAVFTLTRDNGYRMVDIEQVEGCGPHVITFSGDKGQVAGLLPLPCILFDDKEENVRQVQCKGYQSDGVVYRSRSAVHRGRRRGNRRGPSPVFPAAWSQETFRISRDPFEWPMLVQGFVDWQKSRRNASMAPAGPH